MAQVALIARRTLGAGLVLIVAFACAASASAQGGAATPATCESGQALLRLGVPDDALTAFVDVLRRSPRSKCAREGVAAARAALARPATCATADIFADLGATEAAQAEYLDVLRADPKSACAKKGVEELNEAAAKTATSCAAADALREANQDAEAKTAYAAVLKADPESTCAAAGLDELDDSDTPGEVAKSLLGYVLFPLALLLALLALIPQFGRWRRPLVQIGWIDRLLAPRVRVQDIEDAGVEPAIGKAITARVRETLVRPGGSYRLDRVSGREDADAAVESVEALAPQLKSVSTLMKAISWLVPRARLTTVGTLQSRGVAGAGVTLGVEGTRAPAVTTIWTGPEDEPDDADTVERFQSLVAPAAAWIDYELRAALREDTPTVTQSSRSYAFLQGGLDSARRGEHDAAVRFYTAALEDDPRNTAAMVNLANQYARREQDWPEAVHLLERTLDVLRGGNSVAKLIDDSTWYVALYSLAAHKAHTARDGSRAAADARDHALLLALGAAVKVDGGKVPKELIALDKRLFKRPSTVGGAGGSTTQAAASAVRHALTLRKQGSRRGGDPKFAEFVRETVKPSALALLAGTALAAQKKGEVEAEPGELVDDVAPLRRAASGDAKLDPVGLAAAAEASKPLSWRVRYNLACFWAQVGRRTEDRAAFKTARDHLTAAVRDAPLVARRELKAWALLDPSLAPALSGWEGRTTLLGSAAKAAASGPASGLERVHAIGGFAARLREEDIRTVGQLRRATDTQPERAALAARLGVRPETILEWAGLASLVDEIDGVGAREANLLDAAGVSSVGALGAADPVALHRVLSEVNAARRLVKTAPSRVAVASWIEQAQSTAGPI